MSIADDAYVEAVRLIGNAKREGLLELTLPMGLRTIPPEIGELENLRKLTLQNTDVTDLSPLGKLTDLAELALGGVSTSLTDIGPLSSLVNLTKLSIVRSRLADLGPIASMVQLRSLNLADAIHRASLSPLKDLVHLTQLNLTGNRWLSDISALAGMTSISELNLTFTNVVDFRPLLGLRLLADAPTGRGLQFGRSFMGTIDPAIIEIGRIDDNAERAKALFAYLQDWLPLGEVVAPTDLAIPDRVPAPMEVEVSDTLIAVAGKDGLPRNDANDRAALGWEALREYRQDFALAFNISNYAPLPSYLASFDRAMGDGYDPARVVRIGVQAQRFVAISLDTSFTINLPSGAVGDLRMFAAEMLVYLNRFPDWVAYREDAEVVDAASVREAIAEFKSIRDVLNDTPEVTAEVKQEYAAEVAEGTDEKAGETEAKALVASTREFQRAISEHEAKRHKNNRALAAKGGEFVDEKIVRLMGVPHHVALRLEKPMRALAKKFPTGLGWIVVWYDATFGKDDGAQ